MDADDILEAVHRAYQGNTDYPVTGEANYILRLAFLGDAVEAWGDKGSEENIDWRELFVSLVDSTDPVADKTAVSTTEIYDPPANFLRPASKLVITDSNGNDQIYDFVDNKNVLSAQTNTPSNKFYWITGNAKSGFKIHIFNPVNGTINYDYFKTPTKPTVGADVVEMSKPYFAVHMILSKLYELDSRNDLVTLHEGKAKNLMDTMVIDNDLPPFDNDNVIPDRSGIHFGK